MKQVYIFMLLWKTTKIQLCWIVHFFSGFMDFHFNAYEVSLWLINFSITHQSWLLDVRYCCLSNVVQCLLSFHHNRNTVKILFPVRLSTVLTFYSQMWERHWTISVTNTCLEQNCRANNNTTTDFAFILFVY